MNLTTICGQFSLLPWTNNSIGLCFLELYIHLPVSLFLCILCIVFLFIFRAHSGFSCFDRKIFRVRLFFILLLLYLITVGIFLEIIFSSSKPNTFTHQPLLVLHNWINFVLWISVALMELMLGRSMIHSSRGPWLLVVILILYCYVCALEAWSAWHQPSGVWESIIVVGSLSHLFAVIAYLLTKIPMIFNTEQSRTRKARILREQLFTGAAIDQNLQPTVSINDSTASYFSRLFFCWMNSTIDAGYYGELFDITKLPSIPKRLNPIVLESKLSIYDIKDKNNFVASDNIPLSSQLSSIPILKSAFQTFGREFILLGFFKFVLSCMSLVIPVLLKYFIESLSKSASTLQASSLWASGLVFVSFLSALFGVHYTYLLSTYGCKLRLTFIGLVYRRLLGLRQSSLSQLGSGSLINYLTSDTERIVNLVPSSHELWAMPLQFSLAVFLLYQQLGLACLVGIAFLLVLLPLNRLLASQISKFSQRLMANKDNRIKLMSEMLPCMNAIKLACWEPLMGHRVNASRHLELRALWGQKLLDAGCVFCWAACPALLASITFATYYGIGNKLTVSVVFTSMSLFGMLTGPMNAFPWVINGVIEAIVSIRRISTLFHIPLGEFASQSNHESTDDTDMLVGSVANDRQAVFSINHRSFYWTNSTDLALRDISLSVNKNDLVAITGPVGCGKSTLLLALLGELKSVEQGPALEVSHRLRFAYLASTPWLFAGTVKQNILFGAAYDPVWMTRVVQACGLQPDIDALDRGLDSEVGESQGGRLSGGQRARVALARAVYQRADVYLLDEPLAALDATVGHHVITNCLLGLLRDRIRLIATHQSEWMTQPLSDSGHPRANQIIVLDKGRIVDRTFSRNYSPPPPSVNPYPAPPPRDSAGSCESDAVDQDSDDLTPLIASNDTSNDRLVEPAVSALNDLDMSRREQLAFGAIGTNVYLAYLKSIGYFLGAAILLSLALMQATRNAADWWLAKWIQDTDPSSNKSIQSAKRLSDPSSYYLSVYAIIVASNVVATTFRAILFAVGGMTAAKMIQSRAFNTIIHATSDFFLTTPHGRLINRFSSDVSTVDDALPFQLNILLADVAGLLGILVIACLAMPLLFFVLLPLTFVFWSIQRSYRGAARDLKRLSSTTRSPVYTHFTDTLNGMGVVRGLGQQSRFRQLTTYLVGNQIRAELGGFGASAWLSLRLQLISTLVIAGVVATALLGAYFGWTTVAAAGLATTYALGSANLMTNTIYDATETEKSLIAVERCQDLIDTTPVESDTVPVTVTAPLQSSSNRFARACDVGQPSIRASWPEYGRVEFTNVSLTYKTIASMGQSTALNAINFILEPGERVAIVGRTGSGKTSLFRVLMRLVGHFPGPSTNADLANRCGFTGASGNVFIDGVDIRRIPLKTLRTQILAIGQEPFLFSGCLRDNLDPEKQIDDERLTDVLVKCGLADSYLQATLLLDRDVGEAGTAISSGQRQLVCLARALLRESKPKVICLDEATSAVDSETERLIHQVLDSQFPQSTTLLIVHRLESARTMCSRVLLIDSGQLVKQGSPEDVLQIG